MLTFSQQYFIFNIHYTVLEFPCYYCNVKNIHLYNLWHLILGKCKKVFSEQEDREESRECQILQKRIQDIILWHCKFLQIVCFHTFKYAAGMLMSK